MLASFNSSISRFLFHPIALFQIAAFLKPFFSVQHLSILNNNPKIKISFQKKASDSSPRMFVISTHWVIVQIPQLYEETKTSCSNTLYQLKINLSASLCHFVWSALMEHCKNAVLKSFTTSRHWNMFKGGDGTTNHIVLLCWCSTTFRIDKLLYFQN